MPVLAYSIPADLVHKGYSCIGKDGETVKVVPRELTAEEIAKRDAEIKKEKDAEAAGVARKRKDQELTKLMRRPETWRKRATGKCCRSTRPWRPLNRTSSD